MSDSVCSNSSAEEQSQPVDPHLRKELLAEYAALRDEVVKRLGMRHQTLNYTLVVAGGFLALGVQGSVGGLVILVFPVLALFLAIMWAQNDVRIGQIGSYLKRTIESKLLGLNWESDLQQEYLRQGNGWWKRLGVQRVAHVYTTGIFLTAQLSACILGLVRVWQTPTPDSSRMEPLAAGVLLIMDLFAMYMTFKVITQRVRML